MPKGSPDGERRPMGVGQTGQDLQGDVQNGLGRKRALAPRAPGNRAQIRTPHILHDDEQPVIRGHQVEGAHDVLVVEGGRDLGLAEKDRGTRAGW